MTNPKNIEVSLFLDELNHPLRNEIEVLRRIILESDKRLIENIKWNGPNYSIQNEDRITMRLHPPRHIQLIFHRGAKKLTQPVNRIIQDNTGLLSWKENDRATISFKTLSEIEKACLVLKNIVRSWIDATKG